MKRFISTLFTTLLFSSVAVVPNAMAQMPKSNFPVGLSVGSMHHPEQPAFDSTKPTSTNTEVLPQLPASSASGNSTLNSEGAHSRGDRSSVDSSYPDYCPSLPPGTKPGDWEYREALEKCLYGS